LSRRRYDVGQTPHPRQSLTEDECAALRATVEAWICEEISGPLNPHIFADYYNSQFLEYLLPFLSAEEAKEFITHVLRASWNDWGEFESLQHMSLASFLVSIRDFIDDSYLDLVEQAINKISNRHIKINTILAHLPAFRGSARTRYESEIREQTRIFE